MPFYVTCTSRILYARLTYFCVRKLLYPGPLHVYGEGPIINLLCGERSSDSGEVSQLVSLVLLLGVGLRALGALQCLIFNSQFR